MTEDDLLAELRELRVTIEQHEHELAVAYARRGDLFVRARDRKPPIVQAKLAEAAGVSDAAVIRVLRARGVGAAR